MDLVAGELLGSLVDLVVEELLGLIVAGEE